jgi:hypothetical protein
VSPEIGYTVSEPTVVEEPEPEPEVCIIKTPTPKLKSKEEVQSFISEISPEIVYLTSESSEAGPRGKNRKSNPQSNIAGESAQTPQMCINRDLAAYCEEEEEEAVELLIDMEESDTEVEEELTVTRTVKSSTHSPTSSESSRAQIGSYVHTIMKSSSS